MSIPAELPDVPDGDYVLAVHVDAGFEETTVEVPVGIYAPAIVQLMTDRPLYQPGDDVLMRAVTLRRTDLTPLAERPGKWRITDPSGTEMLVERSRGSAGWGVADGSFPLDGSAPVGTWTAEWITGDASDRVSFEVRPFRLPRFVVDAAPDRAWYRIGDEVAIEGIARYTSGAPVANAPVEVSLRATSGRWVLPLDWEEAHEVQTGPDGRYRAVIGIVPPDLMDRTTAAAAVTVTDKAGEAAIGTASVVLSHQSLAIDTVTELGGGLVEGFNNRAYLRVTTPDGAPLPDTDLEIKRPYDPSDPGKQATTDEDGVAAIQIDPGPPVTVVEPAPPLRMRPVEAKPPTLLQARDVATNTALGDLATGRSLDAVRPAVARCAELAVGDRQVSVGVQVGAGGAVRRVVAGDDPVSECVGRAMTGLRMPPGQRTLELRWSIPDPQLPSIQWTTNQAFGSAPVAPVLNDATARARRCLPAGQGVHEAEVLKVHWSVQADSASLTAAIEPGTGHGLSPGIIQCLRNGLAGLRLDKPAAQTAMGVATAKLSVPRPPGYAAPQPTTRTAYELAVSATDGARVLGEGKVIVEVGTVPSLRLRPDPSLVGPGETLKVDLIRGPGFYGDLPERLHLMDGTAIVSSAKVEDKAATWTIPDDASGFLHVQWRDARATVFVKPASPLSVAISTDRPVYQPGETAKLTVTTRAGESPVAAGIGLVGVDATLAQLAPLVGPNDFGRVTVRAESSQPAFGIYGPHALKQGLIRGENAAKAVVLRIDTLPMDPAGDSPSSGSGQEQADTEAQTSRSFYRALDRATARLRAWEEAAKDNELLEPEEMVQIWRSALADLRDEGDPAVDGYGRELDLAVLPPALLAMTDPRTLVADGARLPEDFVGWTQYVEQEVIR